MDITSLIKNLKEEVIWRPLDDLLLSFKRGLAPRDGFEVNTPDAKGYYINIRNIGDGKLVFPPNTDRINDIAFKKINSKTNLKKGDLLFSIAGTVGKVYHIDEDPKDWNINGVIVAMKLNPAIVDSKYLYYYLRSESFQMDCYSVMNFGLLKTLRMKDLCRLEVPIPSLETQKAIAKVLDSLESICNSYKEEADLREKIWQYSIDQFFSLSDEYNKGTIINEVEASNVNKDNKESYTDTMISYFSLENTIKDIRALYNSIRNSKVKFIKIKDIAEYRRGSFPQPYGNLEWYDGEESMPFVQVADVGDNLRLVSNTKKRISKLAQPKSLFVPKGTVIVTLQGTLGRVAITDYDAYIDRTLAVFTGFKMEIDKTYFAYALKHKFAIEEVTARGSIIKTITTKDFGKFELPIPSLETQKAIAKILDLLQDLFDNNKKSGEYYSKALNYAMDRFFDNLEPQEAPSLSSTSTATPA